ncbi:arginine biosynthesis ArgJ [Punctularia strigosozonata HHB-11173 SS5]|uniref:arginine biosynthesis ArgJ n=1 Tax=Punctularia strigosozonata (strain HHB-11173) TaxID=741275 RepID=UPI00044170F0|nr:arginine biosynthesis ArgJ [Punctularia strigosozonata HHB-11173 SS5]EIN09482.1 arginine biosynthesis ArgJ [Punctularia strigosozonata HHB-11173 SS5]
MSRVARRLFATAASYTSRPLPNKAHHHAPIPDAAFPHGYLATGLHCGVKKAAGVPDLGLLLSTSERNTSAAACFTRNAFKAAPVVVSTEVLQRGGGAARAVVVNSGCANAVTGRRGMDDAWAMARATDALLGTKGDEGEGNSETLVMSTGVIGQHLPIEKILSGIRSQAQTEAGSTLGTGFAAWERLARAFMTTDTFPKLRARAFTLDGKEYRLAGIDKGAGMIHPDMGPAATPSAPRALHATLLGCIATDAAVSPRSLQSALAYAVDRSFNSISVDGDMSTNDTVVALANGAAADAGVPEVDEERTPELYVAFRDELTAFAADLAKLVVRDGEGASKFVTVTVEGANTYQDAHKIAARISTSALVKTALYGEDANWGRILAATGSIPLSVPLDPTRVTVSFVPADGSTPLPVLVDGEPENVDEARAKEILSQEDFGVRVELGLGKESATYWTCDLSYEYVKINGDYRS